MNSIERKEGLHAVEDSSASLLKNSLVSLALEAIDTRDPEGLLVELSKEEKRPACGVIVDLFCTMLVSVSERFLGKQSPSRFR